MPNNQTDNLSKLEKKDRQTITHSLPPELISRLNKLSNKTGRSRSVIVEVLLNEALERRDLTDGLVS